jgi:hypothetical protein
MGRTDERPGAVVDSPCKDSSEQDEGSRDPQLQPERSRIGGILRFNDSSLMIFGRRGMDDLVEDDGGCGDEFRERHEEGEFGARRG